jgi:hypothetical protein
MPGCGRVASTRRQRIAKQMEEVFRLRLQLAFGNAAGVKRAGLLLQVQPFG